MFFDLAVFSKFSIQQIQQHEIAKLLTMVEGISIRITV